MYRMGLISRTIIEQIPIFQTMNLARIRVLYLCEYGIFVREARIAESVMHYNLPNILVL